MLEIAAFILTAIGSITGTYFFIFQFGETIKHRPLKKILNFGDDELIFVIPRIEQIFQSLLPQTPTEDFIAFHTLVNTLLKINWKRGYRVVAASELKPEDKKRNLVLICAGGNNPVTQEALERVATELNYEVFRFLPTENCPDKWEIVNGIAHYPSPSYEQLRLCQERGFDINEQEIEDVALVAKMTNPWNQANKMLIVAGVRAFGTWGAAHCVSDANRRIYPHKSKSGGKKKSGDFAAVIGVSYKNCDIVHTEIHHLKDLS